jgi:glycosyltransferase involved in cell wall biosynthesis
MPRVNGSGLHTSARDIVAVAPEWAAPLSWLPILSAYVAWVPRDADTCLCLDARTAGESAPAVRDMVLRACEYLAQREDFAEVLLVEEDIDLEAAGATLVRTRDELVQRLGLRTRPLRGSAALVAAHARWAKALHDMVRDRWDRERLERSPALTPGREPLVTVRIPTYGPVEPLLEVALPSVLNGSHRNVEVLVSSDGPQPHARAAVEAIRDPRVRYLELPERPRYATGAKAFWQTAGIFAINHALDEARGDFIAPLDHDDAFTRAHVQHMLEGYEQSHADFLFGSGMAELSDGTWVRVGGMPLREGHVLHGSVMYSRRLAHMRYDPHSWLLDEPGDWNLWRRMAQIGARVVHVDEPVIMHFGEGSSMQGRAKRERPEEVAEDILTTSAAELLAIASPAHGAWVEGESAIEAPARHAAAARDGERRLAMLDTTFPWRGSGFRFNEAAEILRLRPDTVFFSQHRTPEPFDRAVHPLSDFAAVAGELGITDVHAVFTHFVTGLLGLDADPRARTVGNVIHGVSIREALEEHGIRLHATLYPGGGLMPTTDKGLLREIARRSATVFSNTAEILDVIPDAVRVPVPMQTTFYEFRERPARPGLRLVFAADDKPRKGLDTALAALAELDDVHLDVVGPHRPHLAAMPADRVTLHGWLEPDALREVYWNADVFISPVRAEGPDATPSERGVVDGFPTTAASEALCSGCALISSNPRRESWLLRDGEHYLEVPVADPPALAAAIRRLADDPAERRRLAAAGAARLREVGDARAVVAAKLEAMGLAPVPAG